MTPPKNDDTATAPDAERPDSVADVSANAALEHTNGGTTTRSDLHDAGVPMTQGSPDEPIGPEDALGNDATRGDYSDRTEAGPHMVAVPLTEEERQAYRDRGEEVPRSKLVEQTPANPA